MLTQHKLIATRRRLQAPAFERTLHAQVAREVGLQILEGKLATGSCSTQ